MSRISKGRYIPDVDPRELALYTPADASYCLGINPQTLGTWLWGRSYPIVAGKKLFKPLIEPADPENRLLSFFNLAELHVLACTRYTHKVKINAVRIAVNTIQERYPSKHPLISHNFFTNGKDIFLHEVGENENLSTPMQLNFKSIMDKFLHRVVKDKNGLIKKIYPLISGQPDDRIISITHGISSSQPVIDGSGVPVWLIHERFKAGETAKEIGEDFDIPTKKILRAITYIEQRAA